MKPIFVSRTLRLSPKVWPPIQKAEDREARGREELEEGAMNVVFS